MAFDGQYSMFSIRISVLDTSIHPSMNSSMQATLPVKLLYILEAFQM